MEEVGRWARNCSAGTSNAGLQHRDVEEKNVELENYISAENDEVATEHSEFQQFLREVVD